MGSPTCWTGSHFTPYCSLYSTNHIVPYNHIIVVDVSENDCTDEHFTCPERCIPIEKHCDRIIDCSGGEDEAGCRKWRFIIVQCLYTLLVAILKILNWEIRQKSHHKNIVLIYRKWDGATGQFFYSCLCVKQTVIGDEIEYLDVYFQDFCSRFYIVHFYFI